MYAIEVRLLTMLLLIVVAFNAKVYFHIRWMKIERGERFRGVIELFNILSITTVLGYFSMLLPYLRFRTRDQALVSIFWLLGVLLLIATVLSIPKRG
jgi:hypothetical protein